MNTWSQLPWSPELAKEIEAILVAIASHVGTVVNPHGCSYDKYHDYKIHFEVSNAVNQLHGFFLEYIPRENTLNAWPGGLGYYYPQEMKDFISATFICARYRMSPGPGVDGFHYWVGITEEELRRAAA